MSEAGRAAPAPGRHRRRARLYLAAGLLAFSVLAAGLFLVRPRPAPYVPGSEAAAGTEITSSLSRALPGDVPRVRFVDAAREAGIRFRHFHGRRSTQLPEDMGSGAAWGDYDGDGDPDLFLVNESGPLTGGAEALERSPARAALYRNDGGAFTDVTAEAGVGTAGLGMGAAWGDYDGDGDLDLAVTRFGTNRLYRNDGNGTFADVSGPTGVGRDEGFWTGASWADYDRDGDLDLYVCGYVRYRFDADLARRTSMQYRAVVPYTLNPSTYPPERNLLLRNHGGRFADVARRAGVDNPSGRSLSAAWADFDADGWPDLYVANDVSDNAMFRNRGDGTFQDTSHSAWVADYRGAMGLGVGDRENDGDLDIFVTHWIAQENALYENQRGTIAASAAEPMHFVDAADSLGLGQIALDFIGWGTGFIDYDNDGLLDLFVVNGSTFQRDDDPSRLIGMRNLLFWNGGRDRGFYEVGPVSGESFAVENVGRGATFADYDGDGDVDVAVVVNGGLARLLRNDGGNARGWLRVVLRGPSAGAGRGPGRRRSPGAPGPSTTTFATGAVVRIGTGPVRQVREVGGGPSYLGQSPPGEALFGVGDAATVDHLEIAWPSGGRQSFRDIPARSTVTVVEGEEPRVATRTPERPATAADDPERKASVIRFWQTFTRATRLRLKGDWAAAIDAYREALAADPRHEDSLYYLGHCLRQSGRPEDARDAFERLVAVAPESARGHLALGVLLASPDEGGRPDLAGAESHLKAAHEINKEETGPMVRLGEVLIVRGDLAQAGEWLEAAARTNPRSVEAAFLAGYLRWEAGDRAGARAFLVKAVRASRTEAPIKGVLSEGDRKAEPAKGGGRTAAPPLEAPMGRTLFGALAATLRARGAPGPETPPADPDLGALYAPVRDRALALRRGARVPSTSPAR